jgi:hypothetical protein
VSACTDKNCIGVGSFCASTPIACTDRIKGWSTNTCLKYTEDAPGRCLESTLGCTTSTSYEYCQYKLTGPLTETASSVTATCPSLSCIDATKCQAGAAASANDDITEVCKTNQQTCGGSQVCDGGANCVTPEASGASCFQASYDKPCAAGLNTCQTSYQGGNSKFCCQTSTQCHNPANPATGCGTCAGKQ